jgi:hypothetical protein
MKQIYSLLTAGAVLLCVSCNKSLSEEAKKAQEQATAFQANILNHSFHLVSYYSDIPIDYNPYDSVVKSETDLNVYVLPYLWDDQYTFGANGDLKVNQGANKMPGETADIFHFNYKIYPKGTEVDFDYFDYYYKPSTYMVSSFNDSSYIISCPGPKGSHLFSKFLRLD